MDINNKSKLIDDLCDSGINIQQAEVFISVLEQFPMDLEMLKIVDKNLCEEAVPFEGGLCLSELLGLIHYTYGGLELLENNTVIDPQSEDESEDEFEEEPGCEPECPHDGEGEIDCEFEVRHGENWCNTHNCYA